MTTLLALSILPMAAKAAPTLVVFASGTIAGGVGPIMQIHVNGAVVGAVEVRAVSVQPSHLERR